MYLNASMLTTLKQMYANTKNVTHPVCTHAYRDTVTLENIMCMHEAKHYKLHHNLVYCACTYKPKVTNSKRGVLHEYPTAGWNSNGFALESGNQLLLSFMLPNPGDSIGIHETDLWLFPKASQLQNNSVMDLTLLVIVELAHATKPRREVMNYSWRMDSGCVRLNMTGLSRKIINNLQKRGLERTNISVSIEVVAAREPEIIQGNTIALDMDLQEGCSALRDRNSNEPFLVMKYYNEEQLAQESSSSPSSRQQKRQTESGSDKPETSTADSHTANSTSAPSWNGCSVVPLMVNLTKAFGDFIILPKEINIQDCYGSCNTGQNAEKFTLHAKIKEQVKLTEGVNPIQRGDACCAPSSFKQQDMLIRKENYIAIVSFPDMVVAACHCL